MSLDIRIPIGLMFGVIGLILIVFGIISDPNVGLVSEGGIYERSLGINVNLIWGWLLLGFAALMLRLAYRARRRAAKNETTPTES
jgi:hypothetical protein